MMKSIDSKNFCEDFPREIGLKFDGRSYMLEFLDVEGDCDTEALISYSVIDNYSDLSIGRCSFLTMNGTIMEIDSNLPNLSNHLNQLVQRSKDEILSAIEGLYCDVEENPLIFPVDRETLVDLLSGINSAKKSSYPPGTCQLILEKLKNFKENSDALFIKKVHGIENYYELKINLFFTIFCVYQNGIYYPRMLLGHNVYYKKNAQLHSMLESDYQQFKSNRKD